MDQKPKKKKKPRGRARLLEGKCIACGADAVMIGSPIARAEEAPGRGFHWGMATPTGCLSTCFRCWGIARF